MSSHLRTKILSAVTTIRGRLDKTYRDDAIVAALDSLEEAINVEPIEAEREQCAQMLLDRADYFETGGHVTIAEELVHLADEIVARGEISEMPKTAAGGA